MDLPNPLLSILMVVCSAVNDSAKLLNLMNWSNNTFCKTLKSGSFSPNSIIFLSLAIVRDLLVSIISIFVISTEYLSRLITFS